MSNDVAAKITDHVYLGSREHAKDRDFLRAHNIRYILNMTPTRNVDPVAGVPNFFEKTREFTYKRCAVYDNASESIHPYLQGCLKFIDTAKHHGCVLVHCNKGVSRSASIVVAVLMKERSLTYDSALAIVKQRRPICQPNQGFERQLRAWEHNLDRERARQSGAKLSAQGPALPPGLGNSSQVAEATVGPTTNNRAGATGGEKTVLGGTLQEDEDEGGAACCEECEEEPAAIRCGECDVAYCKSCCDLAHEQLDKQTPGAAVEEKQPSSDHAASFVDLSANAGGDGSGVGVGQKRKEMEADGDRGGGGGAAGPKKRVRDESIPVVEGAAAE